MLRTDVKEILCIMGIIFTTFALGLFCILATVQYHKYKACTEYGLMKGVEVKYIADDGCQVKHNNKFKNKYLYELDTRNE